MVFIRQLYCSLCLNSFFNKLRVRKNAFGQVSCKFFSWTYSNSFQNGKKRYYSFRKPGKVLPSILGWKNRSGYSAECHTGSSFSSYVKGLSENKIRKTYSITVTSLKADLDSNEFIIKKTIGKPKGAMPLSFIQIENSKTEDDPCNSDLKMSNQMITSKTNEHSMQLKTNKEIKESSSIQLLNSIHPSSDNYNGVQNMVDSTYQHHTGENKEDVVLSKNEFISNKSSSKMDLRAYVKNLISNDEEAKLSYEGKKICCYSPRDTLILNPNEPLTRMIIHFKNNTVHVVEPSDFDYLNEAHYFLRQARKSTSGKPSRINFIKFDKVEAKENPLSENIKKSRQTEFGHTILKRQDSICLENISNKCWIPISTDQPEMSPGKNEQQVVAAPIEIRNKLSSGEDSDSYITKIPIKKEKLIDEKVVPSRSILDILNSVDRSAVIIHKDLYITDRIIQKIKNEKKKEEKNEGNTIEAKGIPLNKGENNHLNFSGLENTPILLNNTENKKLNYELLIQEYLSNLQDLHSKYNMLLESMNKLINQTDNIIFFQTNGNQTNKGNLLLFSLKDSPDFKGVKTTDIIKKAASIINKEGYYQKKILNTEKGDQCKNPSKKDVHMNIPSKEDTPLSKTTDKCSETDDTLPFILGNSEIVKVNSCSSKSFNKIPPEKYVPSVINTGLDLNQITPLGKSMNSEKHLENNKLMFISENKDKDILIKPKSESHFKRSEPDINKLESENIQCPKHSMKNNNAIFNNSIDSKITAESLVSFECTPWVDRSVECLMSSMDNKDEKKLKEQKNKKNTSFSLTKSSNNEKPSGTEYKTKTLITVIKKNDITDINIAEKETFIDSNLPVPFSTETSFQIFGSTETIQKEVQAFENIKKDLISSLGDKNSINCSKASKKRNQLDVVSPDTTKKENVKTEENQSTNSITNTIAPGTEKLQGTRKTDLKKSMSGLVFHKKEKVNSKRSKRNNNTFTDKNESSGTKNLDEIRKSARKIAIKKLQTDIERLKQEYATISKTSESFKQIDEGKDREIHRSDERNKQKYGETYVNLLENAKKNSNSKQKQKKSRGIIDHKSLSNRDKKILKEILKGKLKSKKSIKAVKKSPTNINYNNVSNLNETGSTKAHGTTVKEPIHKTANLPENIEKNNQSENKNSNDPNIIIKGENFKLKVNSKVDSTASGENQPQVKSFDAGYSYYIDMNKGLSQPNSQFPNTNHKEKFESNPKANAINNQSNNSNKRKNQMNITKDNNFNHVSQVQEIKNTPETESVSCKNLEGKPRYGEINNFENGNSKSKLDINRNNDGLIIQKKNSEAIVNYTKKLSGSIKGQINDKYIKSHLKELSKPLSLEKTTKEQASPDVKNNNARGFPILPSLSKKNKEGSNENSSNKGDSNPTVKEKVGSRIDIGIPQITVIENHKVQNTSDDYKEIFKKNLLEKVKQKIELKNPINLQMSKIKQSSTRASFKSAQNRKQKPNINKISLLNPLNKMKGTNNKLSLKALPERKQNKKQVKGQPVPQQLVQNQSTENPAMKGTSTKETKIIEEFPKVNSKQDQYIQLNRNRLGLDIDRSTFKQQDHKGKIKEDIQKPIKQLQEINVKEPQMAQKANSSQENQSISNVKEVLKSNAQNDVKIVKDGQEFDVKQISKTINSEQTKITGLPREIKDKETTKNTKIEFNINKEQEISLSHRSINIDKSTQKDEKPAEVNEKPINMSPQANPQAKKSNEPPFPTLLIDIDKMAKEIKPDFDKKNRRTCLVPHERIKDFPLWNSRKPIDLPSPQAVIKVCPSKDPQLKSDLKLFPSVTKILNVTLPKESKDMMKLWWKNMNTELGEKGFRFYYKDEITRGNQFHNLVQDHLLWGKSDGSTPSSLFFQSLGKILDDVKDLSVINSHVVHSTLAYRGVVDCVAKYRNRPVIVEWKRLDHREAPNLSALESAFQQLSAYIGAMNYDQNYNFQVRSGVLVLAYSDGSDADLFYLQEGDCEKYWQLWLNRLHKFHTHMKNNSN